MKKYMIEKVLCTRKSTDWEVKPVDTWEDALTLFCEWIKEENVAECHVYHYDFWNNPRDILTYRNPKTNKLL